MSTDFTDLEWQEIGRKLAEPFRADQIKQREGSRGMTFSYVDARDVAERLDEVVGWQNWEDICDVVDQDTCAVRCQLTIHGVRKSDIGYPNAATDAENAAREPLKAACSDALKRAAVHFGVGRHLYRDTKHTGDSAGATGYVRQAPSGRGPSPKQVQFIGGLLAQHGFPPLPEGIDGGTVSTWIDALKTDGPRAQLINPATGQVLRSTGQGDGSMADMDGDLRAADAHFREMAARDISPATSAKPASANQLATIAKLARLTGEDDRIDDDMTSAAASDRITELSRIWNEQQAARRKTPAGRP